MYFARLGDKKKLLKILSNFYLDVPDGMLHLLWTKVTPCHVRFLYIILINKSFLIDNIVSFIIIIINVSLFCLIVVYYYYLFEAEYNFGQFLFALMCEPYHAFEIYQIFIQTGKFKFCHREKKGTINVKN